MKKIFQDFAKVSSSILENVSALHKKIHQNQQKIMQKSLPIPTSKIINSHSDLDKQIKTEEIPKEIQQHE